MKRKFYIILFAILYLITAFSSFFHAVEFFELSNVTWMSIILAFAFEVGQAATLMSILTSNKKRSKVTPWILMGILTLVQIIGNVYSSYKYIMLNSPENLKFFKEPIFIWTTLPDAQATVIITYISAAILPICALLLTSMVTNYLENNDNNANNEQKEEPEDIVDLDNEINPEDKIIKGSDLEELPYEEIESTSNSEEQIPETTELDNLDQIDELMSGEPLINNTEKEKSRFLNI